MTAKSYPAPWGKRVWFITLVVVLLAVTLAVVLPLLISSPTDRPVAWIVPGVLVLVCAGSALFGVRGFEITDNFILIKRSLWATRLPLNGLQSVEADPHACERAWKICGNDGLFAMHGWFRNKRLGKFRAFVTDPENAVVLRYPDRIVVISPEKPRQFVSELQRRLGDLKEKL